MGIVILTKDNYDKEVLASDRPVLIDFWATWCGPCRMIAPVVEEIAAERQDTLKVCKVDVDEQGELANVFNIASIPTLVLVENGKVKAISTGYRPKEDLIRKLGL